MEINEAVKYALTNGLTYEQLIAYIDGLHADGNLTDEDYNKIILYILANGNIEYSPRDLIQIRRGNQANLPELAQGELGLTLDTERLYAGGLNGNIQFPSYGDLAVDLRHFGAVGDGVADDTAAFTAWLQNLYTANNYGYIPKGKYKISQPIAITQNVKIVGDGVSSQLIFTGNGLSVTASKATWGCVFQDFAIMTTGTTFTGMTLTGNYHRLTNLFFGGLNVDADSADYFWATALNLSAVWYTYISKCRTFGGPIHTESLSYNRGVGIAGTNQTVNTYITNCTLANHDSAVTMSNDCEALCINACVLINNNSHVIEGGYYNSITNSILDMGVNYGVQLTGLAANVSNNFIAQHYYAPQSNNPNYQAIIQTSTGGDATIANNYLATTTQPNNGITIDGPNCTITSNSFNWFKTGITINADKTVCSNNFFAFTATADIALNASKSQVFNNILALNKIVIASGKTDNHTQVDEFNTQYSLTLAGGARAEFDIPITPGWFTKAPAYAFFAYNWHSFKIYADPPASTPTALHIVVLPDDGGTVLPTLTTTIGVKMMRQP